MSAEIDQGTIIYGIRSSKYSSTPCYGVIITARCDIAQCKVPKYYYLVAVDASTWFYTEHGFQQTFSNILQETKKNVKSNALDLNLDGEVLLSSTEENQDAIMRAKEKDVAGDKKSKAVFKNLKKALEKYRGLIRANDSSKSRRLAILKDKKIAVSYLKEIDAGKHMHYYFLPQTSYLKNGIKSKGLVIDLLEIGVLSLSDAEKLTSPFSSAIYYKDLPNIPNEQEIPYLSGAEDIKQILKKLPEYLRLKRNFWLEDESDFVAIEGTTQSPWCEHLMQRFSNAFIRIGLDNPNASDFESIIDDIYTEVNE